MSLFGMDFSQPFGLGGLFGNDPGSAANPLTPGPATGTAPNGMVMTYDPGLPGVIPPGSSGYGGMFGMGPMSWKDKLATLGAPVVGGLAGATTNRAPVPPPANVAARQINPQSLMALIAQSQRQGIGMPGTASPMGMPQNLPTMNFRRPY